MQVSWCLGGRLISIAGQGYYFLRSNTVRADDQIRASIQLQPKYPGWNSTEQKARSVNGSRSRADNKTISPDDIEF